MTTYDPIAEFATTARLLGAILAAAATSVVLMACSDAKPVSFYKAHAAERASRVEQCVATAAQSEDCLNAKQAEFEAKGIPAKNGRASPE